MLRRLTTIMLLPLSVLLCACVAPTPSSSIIGLDKTSLVKQLGKPQREASYPEGERWDYSRGQYGVYTYFVYFDPTGTVSRYELALSEERFSRIQPGMTKEDVIQLIGEAPRRHGIARHRGYVWGYRNFWSSACLWFLVEFDAEDVVRSAGYSRRPQLAACR